MKKTTRTRASERKAKGPTPAEQAERLLSLKAEASALYQEIDRLQQQLIDDVGVGVELTLADGRVFTIVDPFIDAAGNPTKLWRHVPVSRYDLKITSASKGGS